MIGAKFAQMMFDDPENGDLEIAKTMRELTPHTKLYDDAASGTNTSAWKDYWETNICPEGHCGMLNLLMNGNSFTDIGGTPINEHAVLLGSIAKNKVSFYLMNNVSYNVNFLIPEVACEETISLTETFSGIKKAPPVKLIESYYQCSKKFQNSFSSNIGNGSATSKLYVGIIMTILLFVSKMYMNKYTRGDKDQLIKPAISALYNKMRNDRILTKIVTLLHREGKLDLGDLKGFDIVDDGDNTESVNVSYNPMSAVAPPNIGSVGNGKKTLLKVNQSSKNQGPTAPFQQPNMPFDL